MNNQASLEVAKRMQQLREERPWLEEYQIEAIVEAETGLDPSQFKLEQPSAANIMGSFAATPEAQNYYKAYSQNAALSQQPTAPAEPESSGHQTSAHEQTAEQRLEQKRKEEEAETKNKAMRKIIRKNISREVNQLSFTLLIYVLATAFIGALFAGFMIITMGWDINQLYEYISAPRHAAVIQGALMFIFLALPFIFYVFFHKLSIGDMIPLRTLRKGETLPMVMFGLGTMMVNGCFQNFLKSGSTVVGANYSYDTLSLGSTTVDFIISLACLSLIPALVETVVFNGVILQVLRRRGGDSFALIVSSLLYALMFCNFYEMPGAFLVSIALGYMVIFSGSIIPAMICRLVERLLTLLITQYAFNAQSFDNVTRIDLSVTVVIFALALISSAALLRKCPDFFVVRRSDSEIGITLGYKLRIALTRPIVLVIILYSVTFAVLQLFPIDQMTDFFSNRFFT